MKKMMKKGWMILLSSTLVSALLMAALPGTAFASANEPQGQVSAEKTLKSEKTKIRHIAGLMNKANKAIQTAERQISNAQARGVDTSAIESALSAYQAQLASIQAAYQDAVSLYTSRSGFDRSGTVTDLTEARTTVMAINSDLSSIFLTLNPATSTYNRAYSLFLTMR